MYTIEYQITIHKSAAKTKCCNLAQCISSYKTRNTACNNMLSVLMKQWHVNECD